MNSNRNTLAIIGGIVVLVIVGIIVYAATQGGQNNTSNTTSQPDQTQSTDANNTSQTDTAAAVNSIEIKNYMFMPATITVKVGTKVTWTNQDTVKHTVTSDESAPAKIDSGLFGKGETFSYTFEKAGTYTYYCQPHPYMKGTVVVTE